MSVDATIENTGDVSDTQVVRLYFDDRGSKIDMDDATVSLAPGETSTITLTGTIPGVPVGATGLFVESNDDEDAAGIAVEAGPAEKVVVGTQPTNSTAGQVIEGPPTAVAVDAGNNPIPNVDVAVTEVGGYPFDEGTTVVTTSSSGTATFDDLVIEQRGAYGLVFSIDASDSNVDSDDEVESNAFDIVAGPPASVTYSATPSVETALADGTDNITYTVAVTDAFANPVEGVIVEGDASAGSNILLNSDGEVTAETTNFSGEVVFEASSTHAQDNVSIVFVEQVNSNSATGTATFEAGSPSVVTLSANPSGETVVPSGVEAITYTVTVLDANANPVGGVDVEGDASAGTNISLNSDGEIVTKTTDSSGEAVFDASSTDSQSNVSIAFTEQENANSTNGSATFESAHIARSDGRNGESYTPPAPTPGTNANPIGRLKLSADVSGAALSSITVTQDGPTPTGVNSIELWRSSDNTFEAGSDTELVSKSYSDNVTFSSLSPSVPTGGRYVFVVVDLASDAAGDYNPEVPSESDIGFAYGTLSTVNGSSTSSFTDAYLSSSSTTLPVELASFTAEASESGVALKWRTASEQNNAGFRVQHRADSTASWEKVGFVDSKAAGGTASEAKTYRFTITDDLVPGTHQFRLEQVDLDGTAHRSAPVAVDIEMRQPVRLTGPAPNPVHSQATVSFAVKEAKETTISLYNVLGQKIETLYRGTPPAGEAQSLQLTTQNLASGTYLLRLRVGDRTETQRVTVVQ